MFAAKRETRCVESSKAASGRCHLTKSDCQGIPLTVASKYTAGSILDDVNKRVSRFAANIPLIQADLCRCLLSTWPERAYISRDIRLYE